VKCESLVGVCERRGCNRHGNCGRESGYLSLRQERVSDVLKESRDPRPLEEAHFSLKGQSSPMLPKRYELEAGSIVQAVDGDDDLVVAGHGAKGLVGLRGR
jgi:hypothetical protein